MSEFKNRHEEIQSWIYQAASSIRQGLSDGLDVDQKTAANDLVTNLDKSTEEFIVKKIKENYPDEKIISEEGFGDQLSSLDGNIWIIDPIDGTLNFVKQHKNYCMMIALYKDGVGELAYIYDVYQDLLYSAIKGEGAFLNDQQLPKILDQSIRHGLIASSSAIMTHGDTPDGYEAVIDLIQESLGLRITGSAGLEAVDVATNALTAYLAKNLKPWDIAAGKLIVEELGGVVKQLDGSDIDLLKGQPTVFANPQAYQEIRDRLAR